MNSGFWKDKHVLITGHTGFKGSWLSLLLSHLGARVYGIALDPTDSARPTDTEVGHKDNLYDIAHVSEVFQERDIRLDLRDIRALYYLFYEEFREGIDVVFHLAAQPLVIKSYHQPRDTIETNIMGTVNLLEFLRPNHTNTRSVAQNLDVRPSAIIVITSDKVYRDNGLIHSENDTLGGDDPYSASKACVELIVDSYRKSFFNARSVAQNRDGADSTRDRTRVATARAGNVIGGGDFGEYRLVPDIVRALIKKEPLTLRNPEAVRPWQHVLDPLAGYVLLAERLCGPRGNDFECAWNFGPSIYDVLRVEELATRLMNAMPGGRRIVHGERPEKETDYLLIDSERAHEQLSWRTKYQAAESIDLTAQWYAAWMDHADMVAITKKQVGDYVAKDSDSVI